MTTDNNQPSAAPHAEAFDRNVALAGWWRRVGATIVDGLVTGAIAALLAAGLHNTNAARVGLEELVTLIYTVVLVGGIGRTVGTWSVGTKVIRGNGAPRVGYIRSFLRWLIQQLLAATIIGGILDILWPLWDPRNQTLHDKAAGTLVTRNFR